MLNSNLVVCAILVVALDTISAHLYGGYVKNTDPNLIREVKTYKRPWEIYHNAAEVDNGKLKWSETTSIFLSFFPVFPFD